MIAYCYASGLINFGHKMPAGALPIARGPSKSLRDFIDGVARHGYKTKNVKGRPTKVQGSDCLLVPGIPEALDQSEALDNLHKWLKWITGHAPDKIEVERTKMESA